VTPLGIKPVTFRLVGDASTNCATVCPPCVNKLYINNKKGKAVPLQDWRGPEGSRKLRFLDFMTMAQDGGKVVSLTHRLPLPPGNAPGTHFCYRLS